MCVGRSAQFVGILGRVRTNWTDFTAAFPLDIRFRLPTKPQSPSLTRLERFLSFSCSRLASSALRWSLTLPSGRSSCRNFPATRSSAASVVMESSARYDLGVEPSFGSSCMREGELASCIETRSSRPFPPRRPQGR